MTIPRVALVAVLAVAPLVACTRGESEAPVVVTPSAPVTAPAPTPAPAPRPLPPDATSLAAADRDYLIAQGLGEPESELIADLRTHPELIRCKGTAGGTPGFHDPEAIHILGRDKAQAQFDDGHVQGSVDLSFTVQRGKIDWDVEKLECDGEARMANAGKP
ncbi:MAG: hypothetical protein ACREO3_05155 [Arenimonas sp.]